MKKNKSKNKQKARAKLTQSQIDEAIEYIEEGFDTVEIAEDMGVSVNQIAAVKAHITMGTY